MSPLNSTLAARITPGTDVLLHLWRAINMGRAVPERRPVRALAVLDLTQCPPKAAALSAIQPFNLGE